MVHVAEDCCLQGNGKKMLNQRYVVSSILSKITASEKDVAQWIFSSTFIHFLPISSAIPWSALICFISPKYGLKAQTYKWLYQAVLGCTWLYQAVPGCTWLHLAVPGCTWLYLAGSYCTWLPLAAPGCTWLNQTGSFWLHLAFLASTWLSICGLLGAQSDHKLI